MRLQQIVAEPVDEEDDVAFGVWEGQGGRVELGVQAHGCRDGGEHVTERPVVVGRGGELPSHFAVGHEVFTPAAVRAASDSAKVSRLATASFPSAAALTRIEKSSEAITPV